MPRKKLERSNFYPYHVYNRTLEKDFYPINSHVVWNKCVDLLAKLRTNFDAKIHAFVLMSNHYHLLVSTPKENLDDIVWYYQSCFANWMCKLTNRKIYSFQSRYKWSLIKDFAHFQSVYKYVARNPIRAGLSKSVEGYPFSSFSCKELASVWDNHEFMPIWDENGISKWLNLEHSDSSELDKIRRGLLHNTFCIPNRIRPDKKRAKSQNSVD